MTTKELIEQAQKIYEARFKSELERTHLHSFVAIEPDSETYLVGRTLSEAAAAAREVYPNRRCAILRVGHPVAVDLSGHLEIQRQGG